MLSVSSQCVGSIIVGLACISSMCFVQCFLAVNLFIEPLDYYFTPITPPSPLIFPLILFNPPFLSEYFGICLC